MRLTWPIEDPLMGMLQLIDEALEDYKAVVAGEGYTSIGLPREWEIREQRLHRKTGSKFNVLTCVVEVIPLVEEAA